MALTTLVLYGLAYTYGLVCFVLVGVRAILDGHVFKRPSKAFWAEVESARDKYWDLSTPTLGFSHRFHRLGTGQRLHYLLSQPADKGKADTTGTGAPTTTTNLVVFLHGWPDSSLMWHATRAHVPAAASRDTTFVALDFPGRGGSDGLDAYGPDEVLEALADFVLGMRARYLARGRDGRRGAGGRVVLVAHDWGAVCGFRLAAEAPGLADRFVLTNAPLMALTLSNLHTHLTNSLASLRTYILNPTRPSHLPTAWRHLSPALSQLGKSFYVFVFNLPSPLPRLFLSAGDAWFMRVAHAHAHARGAEAAALHAAGSFGPGRGAARSVGAGGVDGDEEGGGGGGQVRYPGAVARRAGDRAGGMAESVRLYSDGLATGPWRQAASTRAALATLSPAGSRKPPPSSTQPLPPSALGAPTTLLWGADDPALDSRITLAAIGPYLAGAPGSAVLLLPGLGHWTPVEGCGPRVLGGVVGWALGGERGDVKGVVEGVLREAEREAEKEVGKGKSKDKGGKGGRQNRGVVLVAES